MRLLLGLGVLALLVPGLRSLGAPRGASEEQEAWSQAELERVSEAIRVEIEELRGQPFARPVAVQVLGRERLEEMLTEDMREDFPPELVEAMSTAARMLGLLPVDVDLERMQLELLREQVAGFYIPGSDTFYLVDTFRGDVARVILAHELTHALDDQLFDLDAGIDERLRNSDALFAYQAVAEGSGMLVMTAWSALKVRDGELAMADMLAAQETQSTEKLADAPRFVWLPLLAAYLRGAAFLQRTDSVLGGQMVKEMPNDDVTRAFREPPHSSEQILHPEKYWDAERRDDPRPVVFDTSRVAEEGWSVLYEDTLGEIHLGVLTTPPEQRGGLDTENPMAILGLRYSTTAAEGWGGDRLVLLGNGERRVLRLVTLWDSERDAGEFLGTLGAMAPALEADLAALAEREAGRARARLHSVDVEYGAGRDEVVLTLQIATRPSELRRLLDRLEHAEVH